MKMIDQVGALGQVNLADITAGFVIAQVVRIRNTLRTRLQ